jgi:Uma2 family endonuclease
MVSQLSKSQSTSESIEDIFYPEGDGKPMADNTKQFRWILTIQQNIDWLYANDDRVFVAGDLFWYPVKGQNKIVVAPDTMVVFGRPKGDRGSYQQWLEDNIAPQVVFEILSPCNSRIEMSKKLLFYALHNVEEYYVYNPDTNDLEIWIRGDRSLDSVSEVHNWVSPRLGIRFDISEELQIYRPDGTKFYSYIEINQMLELERDRAELERDRANQERDRADQASQQLAEMVEQLKQYRDRFGDL